MALATERPAPAASDAELEDDEEELFTRPKAPAKDPAPAADPDDAPLTARDRREFNRRLKDAETRAEESKRNADFWAARASQAPPPAAPAPKKDDEPEDDDASLMEEFTRSPTAFMKKMAKKMGFITRAEQEQYLSDNLQTFGKGIMKRIGTDRALLKEFPDLDDPTSEFAKRTMEIVDELTEGDERKRSTFFKAAAKLAKQEFAGKNRRRARPTEDEDDMDDDTDELQMGDAEEETAAERRSRIARQGPRGSGRTARPLIDTGSTVMQNLFDQFDVKPERRAEVMKKVKIARKNAITEGM